jgi:hypothetical protein
MTKTYIYESPDGGSTVYRREIGTNKRLLLSGSHSRKNHDMLMENQLWWEIRHAAESDPVLSEMLDQVKIYHALKSQP